MTKGLDDEDEEERTIDVHKVIDAGKVQKLVTLEKAPQEVVALEKLALPPHLANHFKVEVLRKMLYNKEFRAKKFERWYQAKLSNGVIREELHLEQNKIFKLLLLDYINNFKPSKDPVAVVHRNQRVHFGENTVH